MVTILMVPLVFFGLLELGLRAIGAGHPTSFFIEEESEGNGFVYVNHQYTFRFFPRSLARSIIPHRMQAEIPRDTYRIFVFGESAANGDPEPAYSFGRHLEILLNERFPGTQFEVVCTAITAINSNVIRPIALDCAEREADLWLVYMGNNEMIGPYGASTIFGAKAPPLPFIRSSLAIKETRIGQLMNFLVESWGQGTSDPNAWGGINMFTKSPLRPHDPNRLRVYGNFRRNLDAILDAGQEAGVPVLVSTVSSNLRDCAPFISLNAKELSSASLALWQSEYEAGRTLEATGSYPEALRKYEEAAAIDATHAELQFRMGRCRGLTGDLVGAHEALIRARDLDGLVVRADSTINQIIREVVENRGDTRIEFVDAEALIAGKSPGGIPGREMFYEHVHFTLQGNYEMAVILGDKLLGLLPDPIRASDTGRWAQPGTCHLQLAVTLWDKHRLWSEMVERLSTPPFILRENNSASLAFCQNQAFNFQQRINPEMDRLVYARALAANPDDYFLHQRFAHYLQLNGKVPEAIPHLEWITDTFPRFEGGHQDLGTAFLLTRQFDKAEEQFRRVLELNPRYARALKGLETIDELRAR